MSVTSGDTELSPLRAGLAWRLRGWLARLLPGPVGIDGSEAWRVTLGTALGVLFAAGVSRLLGGPGPASGWLVAPLGASAVLVFAVPASPLAQPWSVLAGNTLSALVGIACARALPDPSLAAGVAMAAAVLLMVHLRCLHPPGGAMAVLMVIGHTTEYRHALFPVLLNSLLLVLAGVVYNSLTGRAYPRAQTLAAPALRPVAGRHFTAADLDTALARYNQVLDVNRADLQALLEEAEMAAHQRRLGALRCGDVMSRQPVAVHFGTPLQEAWTLMRARGIKALPVVDRARRVCGIVTLADFMRLAAPERHAGLATRLREALRPSGATHGDKPEVVGQIMTRPVRVASEDRPLADLLPVFAEDGHHHIPVLDAEQRLAGMITQTDLVRSLYQAPPR